MHALRRVLPDIFAFCADSKSGLGVGAAHVDPTVTILIVDDHGDRQLIVCLAFCICLIDLNIELLQLFRLQMIDRILQPIDTAGGNRIYNLLTFRDFRNLILAVIIALSSFLPMRGVQHG